MEEERKSARKSHIYSSARRGFFSLHLALQYVR